MTATIVDTGPLVAYYDTRDAAHEWSRRQIDAVSPPMLTSETVISEAAYLIQSGGGDARVFLRLLQRGILSVRLHLAEEAANLERLMAKYQELPMSLADACLVHLSEIESDCRVLTLDRHFALYRRFGRQVIPVVAP